MRWRTQVARAAALGVGLAAAGLSACGPHREDYGPDHAPPPPAPIANAAPVPAPTTLSCPSGTLLTYENFGEGFLLDYCTSCHAQALSGPARRGAPAGLDLDASAGVLLWRTAIIKDTLGDTATMPPALNVTAADKALAKEWLNCGAPNAGGVSRVK